MEHLIIGLMILFTIALVAGAAIAKKRIDKANADEAARVAALPVTSGQSNNEEDQ